MNWFIALALYLFYLLLHAEEDNELRKKGLVDHRIHWMMRALVALIVSLGVYPPNAHNYLLAATFLIMMVPLTWVFFDIMINLRMDKHPFKYMGTSETDNWFRKKFPENPVRMMNIIKHSTFAATIIIHLLTLRYIGK